MNSVYAYLWIYFFVTLSTIASPPQQQSIFKITILNHVGVQWKIEQETETFPKTLDPNHYVELYPIDHNYIRIVFYLNDNRQFSFIKINHYTGFVNCGATETAYHSLPIQCYHSIHATSDTTHIVITLNMKK
ncbi:MAG: hypothetical protein VXY77_01650 [Pseudomonadota bacterium]|nr:hypothetical protein [Pseudomonadota bacterium]